jgi:hypothetical protein
VLAVKNGLAWVASALVAAATGADACGAGALSLEVDDCEQAVTAKVAAIMSASVRVRNIVEGPSASETVAAAPHGTTGRLL